MDDEASLVAFFGILTFVRGKRVEELVAETVWPFGKMVALGRPGEALPQIGALRMETDLARNWQAAIHSLISRASHVLMAAGISGGLKWELEQLQSEGNRGKCSLLILPEEGSIQGTRRLFAAQNSRLLESPHEYVERALDVRFDSAGLPLFLCARKKSIEGYRVALNACFVPLEKLLSIYSAA